MGDNSTPLHHFCLQMFVPPKLAEDQDYSFSYAKSLILNPPYCLKSEVAFLICQNSWTK